MTQNSLFQPYDIGPLQLANWIVKGPLTRNRAAAGPMPPNIMPDAPAPG